MSTMDEINDLNVPEGSPEPLPEDLEILEAAVEEWVLGNPTPNLIPFTLQISASDVRRIKTDNMTTAIREIFKRVDPDRLSAVGAFKVQIGESTTLDIPLSILLDVFSAEELSIYGFDLHRLLEIKAEPNRYLNIKKTSPAG